MCLVNCGAYRLGTGEEAIGGVALMVGATTILPATTLFIMGSATSKVGRSSGSAVRKFPPKQKIGSLDPSMPKKAANKQARGGTKDHKIIEDGTDPDFAPGDFSRRLHEMGIAQPNPTYSPSSTVNDKNHPRTHGGYMRPANSNTTLSVLEARHVLQRQADEDFENLSRSERLPKRFTDMRSLIDAMKMRDRGITDSDIEAQLFLRPGSLDKLGRRGLLSHLSKSQ